MNDNSLHNMFKLSFGEELGNSISHGATAGILLLSLAPTTIYTYAKYGLVFALSVAVYLISIFLMFLGSTVYHAMEFGSGQKYIMRKLDHCFIYVAIAGTYTPILLRLINNPFGYFLLFLEWAVTILGIVQTALSAAYHKRLNLILYLVMGWIGILILPKLVETSLTLFILILLGGIFYSIGVYFYVQKFPYAHFIWHILIILASLAHFIAIVFFL